jgi:hypothetical protein
MGQSDESMRDSIADVLGGGYECTLDQMYDIADDIIEALPSMVKPLVWVHCNEGSNIHDTKCKYEIERHDSGGRLWRLTKGVTGGGAYIGHYPSATIAQAAADTYNVADIMAAFTGETP